jgi:hypothetical protein
MVTITASELCLIGDLRLLKIRSPGEMHDLRRRRRCSSVRLQSMRGSLPPPLRHNRAGHCRGTRLLTRVALGTRTGDALAPFSPGGHTDAATVKPLSRHQGALDA